MFKKKKQDIQIGRREAILTGKPLPFMKLHTYPVKVFDMQHFDKLKGCLLIMQQSLPIELATVPYLRMLSMVGSDQQSELDTLTNLLEMVLKVKKEYIKIIYDKEKVNIQIVKKCPFKSWIKRNFFILKILNDEKVIEEIPEEKFPILRKQIAEQNGFELPNEKDNLEILESERDIAEQNGSHLKDDIEKTIFSVATALQMPIESVCAMTVYEFKNRMEAISRMEYFKIFNTGEMGGMVKFKNGNPYPSWHSDKEDNGMGGLIPFSALSKNLSAIGDIEQSI